jgi:hypothetical protein
MGSVRLSNLILIQKSLNLVEAFTRIDTVGSVDSSNGGRLLVWSLGTFHFLCCCLLIWFEHQLCHDKQATDIER